MLGICFMGCYLLVHYVDATNLCCACRWRGTLLMQGCWCLAAWMAAWWPSELAAQKSRWVLIAAANNR
jgi:hypothetical protein